MSKEKLPVTAAVRLLRQHKIPFTGHLYPYEEKGGTATSSKELGVPEHQVIKTLIMEDEKSSPIVVLMHGDMQVSTKELARSIGVKTITPCHPDTANRHSGYLVGGTSPFATRKTMPVFVEKSILELPVIYINGGKRGFLVEMEPRFLLSLLKATAVEVGIR